MTQLSDYKFLIDEEGNRRRYLVPDVGRPHISFCISDKKFARIETKTGFTECSIDEIQSRSTPKQDDKTIIHFVKIESLVREFDPIYGIDMCHIRCDIIETSRRVVNSAVLNRKPVKLNRNHPNNLPDRKMVNRVDQTRFITQPREKTKSNYNNRNKVAFRNFNVNKQKSLKK